MREVSVSVLLALFLMLSTKGAVSQETVLLEARRLPLTCADPLKCIPKSQLILRNIASFSSSESREVMSFLNRISSIRGISDARVDQLNSSKRAISARYHPTEMAEKLAPLKAHPGLYFNTENLDKLEQTENFGAYIKTQFQGAGVSFLTEEEWKETPGKPQLKVRYSARRESEGCIIPFSVSITISEEAILVRDAEIKVSATVWAKTARQNLANRNYTIESALREAVEQFVADWQAAG